jgi:hypothetical protein
MSSLKALTTGSTFFVVDESGDRDGDLLVADDVTKEDLGPADDVTGCCEGAFSRDW